MKDSRVEILGNGYVEHLRTLGDDNFIAKFARGSFGEDEYKSHDKNVSLVRYLLEHRHMSPIEAGQMAFKVKVPIFIARQLLRHRAGSYNELSQRYTEHNGDYYLPSPDRIKKQDSVNKQGSDGEFLPEVSQTHVDIIRSSTEASIKAYNLMIEDGVARETARIVLPTNMYTILFMSFDTRNLLHFLSLRDDPHAQWEIQEMARAIADFVKRDFPALYQAYEDFVKHSVTLSEAEVDIVRGAMTYLKVANGDEDVRDTLAFCNPEESKIYGSKRRWSAFISKFFKRG